MEPFAGGVGDGRVQLQEPLSSEQAVLRTSLVEGLLASARRNVDAGNDDIALFEQAHVYLPTGEQLPEERWRSGGSRKAGSRSRRATVEGLYAALGIEPSSEPADDLPGAGRGARTDEGWVASLREPELPGEWGAFELDVDALAGPVPELIVYEDVITYPPVRQDLAFVVPDEVTAGELVAAAHEAAGPSSARCAPSTSTVVSRWARQEVDRLLGDVPVTRADTHRRGCRASSGTASFQPWNSGSAPSSVPRSRERDRLARAPRNFSFANEWTSGAAILR